MEMTYLEWLDDFTAEDNKWYYYEDSDGNPQKEQGFLGRLMSRISEFFKKIRDAIVGFFTGKSSDEAINAAKDRDRNEKLQLSPKNLKMVEQGDISLKELEKCKSADDVNKALDNYRNKKKLITAGKIALTVLTVGAAIGILKKSKDKEMQKTKAYEDTITQLVKRNDEISAKLDEAEKQKTQNVFAAASMEINKDRTHFLGRWIEDVKSALKNKADTAKYAPKNADGKSVEDIMATARHNIAGAISTAEKNGGNPDAIKSLQRGFDTAIKNTGENLDIVKANKTAAYIVSISKVKDQKQLAKMLLEAKKMISGLYNTK
jgi:hypothetical protein